MDKHHCKAIPQQRADFNECIRDYLEAVTGFPNIGD
jgi:hypothetical protein